MSFDLDEIEKRAANAAPGRLLAESYVDETGRRARLVCSSASGVVLAGGAKSEADAEFIAHAREDVVALVARVRELETTVAGIHLTLAALAVRGGGEITLTAADFERVPPGAELVSDEGGASLRERVMRLRLKVR